MISAIEPPNFAVEWCRRLGANPDTLELLRGGSNNKVFRCEVASRKFVLKGYAANRKGEHDRFQAESEFLNYTQLVAPEFVPQMLDFDKESRSLVLESLEGKGFREGIPPSEADINRAVTFIWRLNTDLQFANVHLRSSAADGFLRLTEHLQNIQNRLTKMSSEHLPVKFRTEAKVLIKSIGRELLHLQESTAKMITKGQCEDLLDPSIRCVSPSDFGFHNAIRTTEGVKFFDFEFAGWDDPAKAVADFDLQPRVPLKSRSRVLAKALSQWRDSLIVRDKILFPILQLKWACIILAVLDSDRWKHTIIHDRYNDPISLLQARLQIARFYIPRG